MFSGSGRTSQEESILTLRRLVGFRNFGNSCFINAALQVRPSSYISKVKSSKPLANFAEQSSATRQRKQNNMQINLRAEITVFCLGADTIRITFR